MQENQENSSTSDKETKDQSLITKIHKEKLPYQVFSHTNFEKKKDDYHTLYHDEPHATRRIQILNKYPEVKELFTTDYRSFFIVILVNLVFFTVLYYVKNASWPVYLATLYIVGATLCHTMQVLVHDLTHFTCFESVMMNKMASILCNLPTGIPSAIAFGRYHKDHHVYLNQPGYDADLPTRWEMTFFCTPFRKMIFLMLLPLFYGLRPYFVRPKNPNIYEVLNISVILLSNYFIHYLWGWNALGYMLGSGLIGMGFHPCAMHVIAEHYEFIKNQDTYSYYGILNYPNLNLGYHLEHHDFPNIPWSLLPKLKQMAPEFYDNLPQHYSYIEVALRYILDEHIGPWSRIGRLPAKFFKSNDKSTGDIKKQE